MTSMQWDHDNTSLLQRMVAVFALVLVAGVVGIAAVTAVHHADIPKNAAILWLAAFLGAEAYSAAWNRWSPWAPTEDA